MSNGNVQKITQYFDGTVSNEYNPNKSRLRFDVLKGK